MAVWESFRNGPLRVVPAILYAAVVFAASVAVPPSGGVTTTGPFGLVGVDKWVHAVGYAVFVVLVSDAIESTTGRQVAFALAVVTGYGLGIEIVQSTLPWRSFDALDALANLLGALLAFVVLLPGVSNRTAADRSTPG